MTQKSDNNKDLEKEKQDLIKEIKAAKTVNKISKISSRFPLIIKNQIKKCGNAKNITRLTTELADEIICSLIRIAINEMGKPPCKFAFIVMGSEGRFEQTLRTDQDNAIIFANIKPQNENEVRSYFEKLAGQVCSWLALAGYPYCKGKVMASNPEWCQPLNKWKEYFKHWIIFAEPETLIKTKIFFDFRHVYGEDNITSSLKKQLFLELENKSVFYWHLAKTMLLFKPPLNIFGNISVEHDGEHKSEFSIKKATTPIIDMARIYSLNNSIDKTNTFERLEALSKKGVINETDYQDIVQVLKYLMNLRLKYQAIAIDNNEFPDNYLNPNSIPKLEKVMLKECFSIIESFQTKMSLDFTGKFNPNTF